MTTLLLDAYNLLYRSFVMLPDSITDSEKQPIHGLYGMISAILKLQRSEDPKAIIAAFDVPDVPTFRHVAFPLYQAQRGPLGGENAAEFSRQASLARSVLPHIGIPAVWKDGFEADDVMGTLAAMLSAESQHGIIVSTDRDLLQLVAPFTSVLIPGSKPVRVRTEEEVVERIGVPPHGVTTYKALAGDASDNIPGVSGIGDKSARTLVNTYRNLDTIYENLALIPPRQAKALAAHRDQAYLFRRIVTVVTDLELQISRGDLPNPQIDGTEKAREVLASAGVV